VMPAPQMLFGRKKNKKATEFRSPIRGGLLPCPAVLSSPRAPPAAGADLRPRHQTGRGLRRVRLSSCLDAPHPAQTIVFFSRELAGRVRICFSNAVSAMACADAGEPPTQCKPDADAPSTRPSRKPEIGPLVRAS